MFCERDLWRAWSPGGLPGSRDADGPIYPAAGANRPPKHSPSVSVTARAAARRATPLDWVSACQVRCNRMQPGTTRRWTTA